VWVKKFLARTVPEAMAQVKSELGSEAVILHTSQVKVGGFFGLFGTLMVEVTAAADRPATRGEIPQRQVAASISPAPSVVPAPLPAAVGTSQPSAAELASITLMRNEMQGMKAMMGRVLDRIAEPDKPAVQIDPELRTLHSHLLNGGVNEEAAASLLQRVTALAPMAKIGLPEAQRRVKDLMKVDLSSVETIQTSESGHRVIALVGPTGVGKTTTLAKLAAHYVLGRRLNVAMITADTYRVAAVEQLRTYADILGTPLEVVYDAKELAAAVERQRHRELILVDTAGRSPRNTEQMQELVNDLAVLQADEVYLVLSMTSSPGDAERIVESYLPSGAQRVIFTKWDEANTPGLVYNISYKYKIPLSYITYGQNVPDDIEIADPDKITQAILGD